ncbi:MAG: hypothetical protein FJ316_12030 [SAR202 cluster bacterium]|nr:hypothetical protein [SAR202 cluster bacterium]
MLLIALLSLSGEETRAAGHITVTHLGVTETRPAAVFSTPAFRIPANHLALIWVACDHYEDTGDPTGMTDSARTWTKLISRNVPKKGMTLWQSLEPVETNTPITVTHSTITRCNWVANYYSATRVAQVVGTTSQGAETTTGTLTFAEPGSSGAVAAAFIRGARPASTASAGPGFTLVGTEVVGVELVNRSEFSPQYQAVASMNWSSPSAWLGIAVEITDGSPPATPTPTALPTATFTPTPRPAATATPALAPTATARPASAPTATPQATATPAPPPTPTAVTLPPTIAPAGTSIAPTLPPVVPPPPTPDPSLEPLPNTSSGGLSRGAAAGIALATAIIAGAWVAGAYLAGRRRRQ